jgi:4-hydroxybenzoate polyprenyltransferase
LWIIANTLRHKLIALARLSRIGMSPLTMSVPVLGSLTTDKSLPLEHWIWLALVGLCAHIFGFGLNDLIDYPLDKNIRKHHPLVTGEIARWQAWIWVLLPLPISFGVYHVLLHGSDTGFILLCSSIFASVIFNKWSKWGRIPSLLAEIGLAVSIGLLCLSGSAVDGQLTVQSIVFATTLAFVLMLLNSVPSGLKDIKTDSDFGVESFVISTGSKMLGEDQLFISPALRRYSLLLQSTIFILFTSFFVILKSNPLIISIAIILPIYAALHLRMILAVRSFHALRHSMPLLSGYFNFGALLILIIDRMPGLMQLIVVSFIVFLLQIPLRVGFRTWRRRYDVL